ncbi:flagellin [uncultured Jatrophihabitans sp.]|uniref:flagellin N-terminal helical domain-containing protein n=1 Tax=uncultured Jatrophihabitans sp. TaxID=1610747 RepID=UPI0035CA8DFC
MSLRINTNVAALNAYNNLSTNQGKLEDAFGQLSSGLRINKAADDAAGLSISQGLTSQINGLTQAVSNAQDATNVAQIADGALGTVQEILQRMRTLVVEAGNSGTQDANSLGAIKAEIGNLNTQLNQIGTQTAFGKTALLGGAYNGTFQVGANGGETISLDLSQLAGTAASGVDNTKLGSADASGLKLSGLNIAKYDATAGYSGTTLTGSTYATVASDKAYGVGESTADLNAIDGAIKQVSTARSSIGAVQNQLSYTVTNLNTAITNVTASRSNLTDADLATQVTKMTQQQILTSAATSVLAQANSAPQAILKLLQ